MREVIKTPFFKVFDHEKAGHVLVKKVDGCECHDHEAIINVSAYYKGVEMGLNIEYKREEERDESFKQDVDYRCAVDCLVAQLDGGEGGGG